MTAETMRLSDLCDCVTVQVDPKHQSQDLYIGLEHLESGHFERIGEGSASVMQSAKYLFQSGDVLYGKLRPYLDKAVLVADAGICTTELLVLRAKNGIDPRFLVCVVHAPNFIEYAISGTTGAQHPRTSWNHIREFELPHFSSHEQATIADLAWKIHDAITRNESAVSASEVLKQAAMTSLFTRGLRGTVPVDSEFGPLPESWDVAPLEECAFVQTGVAKGRKLSPGRIVDVPYLRVANVQDGHLELTEIKSIAIRESEIGRFRLLDGDVLLTEGGDFDKLGRGSIWRGQIPLCVHQNHVFAVRPNQRRLLPEFFAYQAQSHYGKAYFLKVAHRTTNLACINTTKLKSFPVLLPPLDEQREIAEILNAIDRRIDLHRRKRTVLGELFKGILDKLTSKEISVSDLDRPAPSAGVVGGLTT